MMTFENSVNRRSVLTAGASVLVAGCAGGARHPNAAYTGSRPKYRGIVYDVGLRFNPGQPLSVEPFDQNLVAFDIATIAKKMHANAIRIEGEDIERLVIATRYAHAEGLTVFFNPWKMNVPITELHDYYVQAAKTAEQLRQEGVNIVFVPGCEITLFNEGIIEGATITERTAWLNGLATRAQSENIGPLMKDKGEKLNQVLRPLVEDVRKHYKGTVTYAAGTWEAIDYSMFDLVGIDHYRAAETDEEYVAAIDRFRVGKPVIVMEVGCCAYKGAAILGSGGSSALQGTNPDGTGIFAGNKVPVRSEIEQADYAEQQIRLLAGAGVEGIFIYVFSFPIYKFGEGARDLDMMTYSLVKTYPSDHPKGRKMPPWAPKEAFHRIADLYGSMS